MNAAPELDLPAQTLDSGSLDSASLDSASTAARQVLDKAEAQVRFIPNNFANMVNSACVLGTFLEICVRLRSNSGFTPVERKVALLVNARSNGSGHCTAATA